MDEYIDTNINDIAKYIYESEDDTLICIDLNSDYNDPNNVQLLNLFDMYLKILLYGISYHDLTEITHSDIFFINKFLKKINIQVEMNEYSHDINKYFMYDVSLWNNDTSIENRNCEKYLEFEIKFDNSVAYEYTNINNIAGTFILNDYKYYFYFEYCL